MKNIWAFGKFFGLLEALFFAPAVFVPKAMALHADFFDASREFSLRHEKDCGSRRKSLAPRRTLKKALSRIYLRKYVKIFAEIRVNISGKRRIYLRKYVCVFAEINSEGGVWGRKGRLLVLRVSLSNCKKFQKYGKIKLYA